MRIHPAILLALAFSASAAIRAEDRVRVVASLPDLGHVAEAVGGDRVEVAVIAAGVQDPHFVDPKPSYVVKLRDADLLLVNGLELEIGWIPSLVDGARNPRLNPGAAGYVDCSRNVPVLEVPGGTVTRAEGDIHPLGNPHYLLDPLNHKIVAETVAAALAAVRPAEAAFFEERKKAFQHRIDEAVFGKDLVDLVGGGKLDRMARSGELAGFLERQKAADKLGGWLGKVGPLRGARLVFYHKSCSYLCARFGIVAAGFVELKAGIQPGPGHLAELVGLVQQEKVPAICIHPFNDAKIPQMVAEKAGARVVVLPHSSGAVPGADDVFGLFDTITDRLVQAHGKHQ